MVSLLQRFVIERFHCICIENGIHTADLDNLNNFHHYNVHNSSIGKYEMNTYLNPFSIRLKL